MGLSCCESIERVSDKDKVKAELRETVYYLVHNRFERRTSGSCSEVLNTIHDLHYVGG